MKLVKSLMCLVEHINRELDKNKKNTIKLKIVNKNKVNER